MDYTLLPDNICQTLLNNLFRSIPVLLQKVAPGGFKNSELVRVYHPAPEQQYREYRFSQLRSIQLQRLFKKPTKTELTNYKKILTGCMKKNMKTPGIKSLRRKWGLTLMFMANGPKGIRWQEINKIVLENITFGKKTNTVIQLGIGMFGDVQINEKTGYVQSPQKRMEEIVEEVKLMDELGVDFFGIGEHHRSDYAVAAPEILLAALSTVTKKIKLGSAVSVISSADPVKVYQDFSMVDLLSNGRVEIMAGRGSFIESFPLFGYDLDDYDDLFDEKLRLLLQLNKGGVINWKGRFRNPLVDQKIYPRPQQKQLPVWVAVGGTPSSVVRAGQLGLPVMFAIIGGEWKHFKPLIDYYKENYLNSGHAPEKYEAGVHIHSFFGENSQAAADYYYPFYSAQMDRVGRTRGWPPYQRSHYNYGLTPGGHLIVGDAEEAAEKIVAVIKEFGLTRFSAHMDVGSPSHKEMMKSIEIYGEKIIPKVKKALKD